MRRIAKNVFSAFFLFVVLVLTPYASPEAEAATTASGTWGSLNWTLDSNGTLTISGSGEMDGFSWNSEDEWHAFDWNVKEVMIQNGVTSIGEYAFSGMSQMTKVTIPSSVTRIEDSAFFCCFNLKNVTIPTSVTLIEDNAFYSCESLTSLTIPSSVQYIGYRAFHNCESLSSITLPSGIQLIGDGTFGDCTSLTSVAIPESVTRIGESAFENSGLTSITISKNVTRIDSGAFAGCSRLTRVSVDASNTSYCDVDGILFNKDKTTLLCFPGARGYVSGIPSSVTRIADMAFFGCGALSSFDIPTTVTSIGVLTFAYSGLTSINIPSSVTYIADRAFMWCASLVHVSFPASITHINQNTFYGCDALTNVEIPPSVTSIWYDAFGNCPNLTLIVTEGSCAHQYAVKNYIPYELVSGKYAVNYNAVGASDVPASQIKIQGIALTLSSTVPTRAGYTFVGWASSSNASTAEYYPGGLYTVDAGITLYAVWSPNTYTVNFDGNGGSVSFSSKTVTNRSAYGDLPTATRNNYTFVGWFTSPSAGTQISSSTIAHLTADRTLYAHWSTSYNTWGDLLWTLDNNGLLTIFGSGEMDSFESDSKVAWLAQREKITRVEIQSGVTTIGDWAFYGCGSLQSISIPASVRSIGISAFLDCTQLQSLTIPANVTYIGVRAFGGMSSLTDFTVDSGNTVFYALNGGLIDGELNEFVDLAGARGGSYTVPTGVTSIGMWAFSNNSTLTEVTIPTGVTQIDTCAFTGCSNLQSVRLPASLTSIGDYVFNDLKSLTDIYYSGTESQWTAITMGKGNYFYSTTIHYNGSTDYTVRYDPNGGYSVPANQIKTHNQALTLSTVTPAHASSSAGSYTVTLNANGGSVSQSTLTAARTTSYTFRNWNTAVNGNGTSYAPGTSYTENASVTLYAQWNSNTTTAAVTLPTPTLSSYTFKGWNSNSGASSGSTGSYTPTGNVTLYAIWQQNKTYTVTFNPNGGTVSPTSKTVTNGSTYGDLPTPTKSNYRFDGWYTASSGGTTVTSSTTVNLAANQTLYAHWTYIPKTYTVAYNANGGTGTPSSQTKEENVSLTLSSVKPSKYYIIQYNAAGGTVTPASKNVNCTFKNWNTAQGGGGSSYEPGGAYTANANVTLYAQWTNPSAGTLATPTRSGYTFDGWYTSASGGAKITNSTTITENKTIFAHWTKVNDNPYNMGDETYSFGNYGDSDSPDGHCFGMSMTSAGYHLGILDISKIGGSSSTSLYSLRATAAVKRPICYYQGIQDRWAKGAIVAGGSTYLFGIRYSNISADWTEVVNYVSDHSYDGTGRLQIGFRKNNVGGHAINFLRYEKVNGQDRIYAYDNNFPTQETYFYKDSYGKVWQAPVQTFSGSIDCIALRDCRKYFNSVGDYDATHALYMPKDAATVQGYSYSVMEGNFGAEEYVMYVIPSDQTRVTIIPNRDYADFIYMDMEYSFGIISDEMRGDFEFATMDEGSGSMTARFRIYEVDPEFGEPDFTLPSALTEIGESAFESIAAKTVYIPDTCASIGEYAFRNAKVKQIRIPAECSIAGTAFAGCDKVQIFGTPGSAAETFCTGHANCTFVTESQRVVSEISRSCILANPYEN